MGKVKKQHYVPQFYLRNYSHNRKNIGMFMLDSKKHVTNASIKSVAYSRYLYGKNGELEGRLGKLESIWARIIRKLLSSKELYYLTREDYNSFLEFIAVSHYRTKKISDRHKYLYEFMEKMVPDEGLNNGNIKKSDFKEFKEVPSKVPIDIALKEAKQLRDLGMILLCNKTNHHQFITCDHPVIFYNKLYVSRNYRIGYGLENAGIQIFMPLSCNYVLCLFDPYVYDFLGNTPIYNIKSKKEVSALNKLAVENAYNKLFFTRDTKESYIREIVKSRTERSLEDNLRTYKQENGNELVHFTSGSIYKNLNFSFLSIKKKYINVPLPDNMMGLSRKNLMYDLN
ncbi:DUF4238 domain-containing protein [Proteinivorax hydrogeniformans]|uniref:DUF4238 domain-containing protein n=1 Tax=Proteinivorax hydrogeniformans TaxID=1826727 RepID=A0AAU8HRD1_9FIRM